MRAIMFAAGRGLRLALRDRELPKVLLQVGGRTLLDWHVLRLVQAGVNELIVITGYKREQVTTQLSVIRRRHRIAISEAENPDFAEGSALSFLAAVPYLQHVTEPVLLMDADMLYPSELLFRLIESQHPTALLIDRNYSRNDDDPMLVPIRDGRPFDFCKRWSGKADAVGESIGFFKIAPRDLPHLIEETSKRKNGAGRSDSYDDVLQAMVKAGRFGYEDVTGLPWTEIDFLEDLQRAQDEVFPAIQKLEAQT